jgi:hypothetical protein
VNHCIIAKWPLVLAQFIPVHVAGHCRKHLPGLSDIDLQKINAVLWQVDNVGVENPVPYVCKIAHDMATSLATTTGKENTLHEIAAPPLIHLIVPIKVEL